MDFLFFNCLGGGLIFLITKYIQCKNKNKAGNNSFIPIIFMLGLTFFKGIFF